MFNQNYFYLIIIIPVNFLFILINFNNILKYIINFREANTKRFFFQKTYLIYLKNHMHI